MYQYADTVEFDLMVVFLVVCVMPLAVFLMQSKTKVGRAMSLALMVLAILYVGGFEHYRICLLYTSPSPRDRQKSRMPSSA